MLLAMEALSGFQVLVNTSSVKSTVFTYVLSVMHLELVDTTSNHRYCRL